jgi:hypothetical protein
MTPEQRGSSVGWKQAQARNQLFSLLALQGIRWRRPSSLGSMRNTITSTLLLVCFFEGTHTIHTFARNSNGTAVTDNWPLSAERQPEV